jgi:hypothetical protein
MSETSSNQRQQRLNYLSLYIEQLEELPFCCPSCGQWFTSFFRCPLCGEVCCSSVVVIITALARGVTSGRMSASSSGRTSMKALVALLFSKEMLPTGESLGEKKIQTTLMIFIISSITPFPIIRSETQGSHWSLTMVDTLNLALDCAAELSFLICFISDIPKDWYKLEIVVLG